MESVEKAILITAQGFDEENKNPTFRGIAKDRNKNLIKMFVKILPHRELFIECVCAILGRELGLPFPKPFLVKVPQEILPNEKFPDDIRIIFGSEDVGFPSIKRMAKDKDKKIKNKLTKRLLKHNNCLDIGVFDEWIANPDRHHGNILFNGKENFIFIDHGLAIRKGKGPDYQLMRNVILDTIIKNLDETAKNRILERVEKEYIPSYKRLPLLTVPQKTIVRVYLDDNEEIDGIIQFLSQRIEKLFDFIKIRMDMDQMELVV